ncbi:hypothetical protein KHS38_19005 [Mucilaginibacter sp. Bleaf8]|uniref:hypothetical protein n=1 Tax=Mucilaginibacter sp. Bleaf8 TaxID=2834430 RepID=UPI001BCBECEB|nr:hypothetical protein [Mucilaginibacter sp. Bleaf8]MBS7566501.1 hypothetical protein [Mucilaginibacter sp. Bleaf8]
MWKKWINIILAVWLINAVTYFHSSNPFDTVEENHGICSTIECLDINTWVDCLVQIADDEGEAATKAHKINSQRKYVHSRSVNLSVFLSPQLLHLPHSAFNSEVDNDTGHYSIGVALLPAYYNFLFRLCPF